MSVGGTVGVVCVSPGGNDRMNGWWGADRQGW